MSAMIVCAREIKPPPPSPCSARARMSASIVGARAQAIDPATKIAMPASSVTSTPVNVAELAVERHHGRRGEGVGGDDPGQVLDVVQVAADGRQGGGDDGLIQRR